VDRPRAGGDLAAHGTGGVRSHHRLGALGSGGRLLHNQGALRRREGGQEPGGQGESRGQAFGGRGRAGHTTRVRDRSRQPSRLAAFGPHPGRRWGARPGAGGRDRPPGPRLRLEAHPRALAGARAPRRDLREGQTRAPERHEALGGGAHNSWQNAHKKLVWCTERRGRVVDFWVGLSDVVVIVRRLVREGWRRYRWEGRPSQRP
jgi:hypothetical protein